MNILVYKSKFCIRGSDQDDFVKNIIANIDMKLRNLFCNLYVGDKKIIFENGFFSFLIVWNFFEIITKGEIQIEENNRLISLSYEVSFTRHLLFWFFSSSLLFLVLIFTEVGILTAFIIPMVWIFLTFLFTQLSLYRLNSKIVDCVSESGGQIVNL